MARLSTYAIDGTPVSSDKLIGTDTAGTVTKNYPLGDVADWLKSSGATAVLGQNNYLFQIALDPDEGRKIGSFSFENYGGDGTAFEDVTNLKFSASSSAGKYIADYLLSTVDQKIMLSQLDDPNSFGIYVLASLVQSPLEPTFYDATLAVVSSNGVLRGNKSYGLATYSALNEAGGGTWGSITGTITNQTDLVDYIDAEIAAIPTPATPTLQSVTDAGAITNNDITIGTTVLRSGSYLNVKPVSNYGIIVRNSGDDNKYISMGVPGDYGFIKYKENTGSAVTINSTGVGIGTTAPASKLEVHQSADSQGLKIVGFDDENDSNLHLFVDNFGNNKIFSTEFLEISAGGSSRYRTTGYLRLEVGGTNNQMQVDHNYMKFTSGGTETMRITPGNVGIGTTAPTEKLHVSGNVLATGGTVTAFASNTSKAIISNVSGGGRLQLISDEGDIYLRTKGGDSYFNAGNVGIGTTAPALQSAGTGLHINAPTSSEIKFTNSTTGATASDGTALVSNGVGFTINNRESGYLSLGTNNSTRLYINSAGNVGIGTTNPFSQLEVKKDSYTEARVRGNSDIYKHLSLAHGGNFAYVSGSRSRLVLQSGDATYQYPMHLNTGGSVRMIIDETGNVGIGTTAPAEKLHVDGNIRTSSGTGLGVGIDTIYSNSVNINNSGQYRIGNAEFISKSANDMNIYQGRMWVTNTGNVGIGNTAPLAKLHVKDGNTLTAALSNTSALIEGFSQSILQVASHSTGYSQLAFGDQDDGFDGGLIYSNASRYLAIEAANVERMRFASNGNVGIGTTAPNSKVHISGTAMQQLRMETAGGPSSSGDTSGRIGDMAYDDDFFYIKTANGWGRVQLDFGF